MTRTLREIEDERVRLEARLMELAVEGAPLKIGLFPNLVTWEVSPCSGICESRHKTIFALCFDSESAKTTAAAHNSVVAEANARINTLMGVIAKQRAEIERLKREIEKPGAESKWVGV